MQGHFELVNISGLLFIGRRKQIKVFYFFLWVLMHKVLYQKGVEYNRKKEKRRKGMSMGSSIVWRVQEMR